MVKIKLCTQTNKLKIRTKKHEWSVKFNNSNNKSIEFESWTVKWK